MLADSPWHKALEKPPTFQGKEMDLHSKKSGHPLKLLFNNNNL